MSERIHHISAHNQIEERHMEETVKEGNYEEMHQIMKLFEKYQRQKHSKDMNKYSNYETNPFCNTNRSASLSSVSTADSLGSSFSDFGSTFSVLTYSSDFETLMRWQCLP